MKERWSKWSWPQADAAGGRSTVTMGSTLGELDSAHAKGSEAPSWVSSSSPMHLLSWWALQSCPCPKSQGALCKQGPEHLLRITSHGHA